MGEWHEPEEVTWEENRIKSHKAGQHWGFPNDPKDNALRFRHRVFVTESSLRSDRQSTKRGITKSFYFFSGRIQKIHKAGQNALEKFNDFGIFTSEVYDLANAFREDFDV